MASNTNPWDDEYGYDQATGYPDPMVPTSEPDQPDYTPNQDFSPGGVSSKPGGPEGGQRVQAAGDFNAQAELDKIFGGSGFKPGETDLANLQGKNPEDRAQFIKDLQTQETLRARPTASAGGMGGDAGYGDRPGIKPGWTQGSGGQFTYSPPAPVRTTPLVGGGGQNNSSSFQDILAQFGQTGSQLGPPGTSGVYPNDVVQQVGQDPLSQVITGGLGEFLGSYGMTPLGGDMASTLEGLISRGGKLDEDSATKAARFEAERQPIESMRKAQTAQLRGGLANRNLLSEPGTPQGSEIGAVGRMEEGLAPFYASAGQRLAGQQADADNARLGQALTLATGLSQAQAQNFLAGIGAGTERQKVLADIALGSLDRNIVWNEFLAQLGLQRAELLYKVQNEGIDSIMPILQMFSQYVGMSNQGYV